MYKKVHKTTKKCTKKMLKTTLLRIEKDSKTPEKSKKGTCCIDEKNRVRHPTRNMTPSDKITPKTAPIVRRSMQKEHIFHTVP